MAHYGVGKRVTIFGMVDEPATETPPMVELLANAGDDVQDDFANEVKVDEIKPLQEFSFR